MVSLLKNAPDNLRNIAIIAHVDHGKTTLVDAMLKQTGDSRATQNLGELIMDNNPLERERGITILSKNTSVNYKNTKINIIDTPGHADFSGEVERVINMTDGCLLVIDAADGPMPQTRYVLKKALEKGLRPIVVINKIDSPNARIEFAVEGVNDLFLDLATEPEQLDFPILYASARDGYSQNDLLTKATDMSALFDAILNFVPAPSGDLEAPFQMLVTSLAYDNHLGQIAIGRISRGQLARGDLVSQLRFGEVLKTDKTAHVFTFEGLERIEIDVAGVGEIVAMSGFDHVAIGDTLTDSEYPDTLPPIILDEPTVRMTFGVNSSPFTGLEGSLGTSREIRARLEKELQTNVSLKIHDGESADEFVVSGRGELHLAILIETMRREGYELEVSKPQAIIKLVDGVNLEPYETLLIDTREDFIGILTENLSSRLAEMTNMEADGQGNILMTFEIPTRGLIGFNSFFAKASKGQGVMSSVFDEFKPLVGAITDSRSGVLVASQPGVCVPYGISNAQGRGQTFIDPGQPVYEGMIVGSNSRQDDIDINICKEKKLTNVRAAGSDDAVRLTPPLLMSLEESLDYISIDELVEITPKKIRLRKKVLPLIERRKLARSSRF